MTSINPVKVLVFLLAVLIFEITAVQEKRAVNVITLNMNPVPDVPAEIAFKADPVGWLGSNSISSFPVHLYAINRPTRVDLRNGEIYSFRLTKVGNKKYVYYATPNSNAGVRAYWLSTDEKITIDRNGGTEFIFTAEMQGCSIHAKHLANGRFEVFHRNRRHLHQIYLDAHRKPIDERGHAVRELAGVTRFLDKNGNEINAVANGQISLNNGILDRNRKPITAINGIEVEELLNDNVNRGTDDICQFLDYDLRGGKSVSWEEYKRDLPENYEAHIAANPNALPKFATPFLFRKVDKWSFVSQQIQYKGFGPNAGVRTGGQIYDFEYTGKGYLTEFGNYIP